MSTLAAERKRRPEIYPFMKESQPPLVEKPFESIPGPRILPVVGSLWQYFPGGKYISFYLFLNFLQESSLCASPKNH